MIVLSTDLRTKIHELLSRLRKVQNTKLMVTIKCREFKKILKHFSRCAYRSMKGLQVISHLYPWSRNDELKVVLYFLLIKIDEKTSILILAFQIPV